MTAQNQLLREALADVEQAHDLSLDLDHYASRQVLVSLADKIKVALAQPAEGGEVVADKYKQAPGSKNCMQCAVAYMLGLPVDAVRDFERESHEGVPAWESMEAFFESHGFSAEMFPPSVEIVGDYLASGVTARGTSHMVVMRGGKLLHDPHPSNDGLASIQAVWIIARRAGRTTPQTKAAEGGEVDNVKSSAGLIRPGKVDAWVANHYTAPPASQEQAVARFNWYKGGFEWLVPYNFDRHNMRPLYLAPEGAEAARKAAQEQLYAERERHTAEVKKLQAEIGRLNASHSQAQQPSTVRVCIKIQGGDMHTAEAEWMSDDIGYLVCVPREWQVQHPSGTWVNFDLRDITHSDPGDEPGWIRVGVQQPSGGEVVAWISKLDMDALQSRSVCKAMLSTFKTKHEDDIPLTLATPKPEPMTLDQLDLGALRIQMTDPEAARAFLRKAGILNERNELAEAFGGITKEQA